MAEKQDYFLAASLGVEIVIATFLGAFLGYQIDLRLNSYPTGMVVGLLLGAIAGLWNAIKLALKK